MESFEDDSTVFSCGHCGIDLGTVNNIVNNSIAENHICFIGASNVNLDYGNKKMFREVLPEQLQSALPLQSIQQTLGHEHIEENMQPRCKEWKGDEVALLIATYKSHKEKCNTGMFTKKKVRLIISKDMKLHGVNKDSIKCDEKWRNLKKTYDKVRMEMEKSRNGNVHWKYFKDFQEIYHQDPRFSPVCTASSSGLIKSSSAEQENVLDKKNKFSPDENKRTKSLSLKDLDERMQKRHEEKMELKKKVFEWFKHNWKKND